MKGWYMDLTLIERKTILYALRYLRANRDDALNSFSKEDDATGEITWPNLLTEGQLTEFISRFENDQPETIRILVGYDSDGKVVTLLQEDEVDDINPFWTSQRWYTFEKSDWFAGRITAETYNNF